MKENTRKADEERAPDWRHELAGHGILNFDGLSEATTGKVDFMIETLLKAPSINLLVGDSGVGKTAFAVQLGVCVSAGVPFLDHRVIEKGAVLYCDSESGMGDFWKVLKATTECVKLTAPPDDFLVWNPYWNSAGTNDDAFDALITRVELVRPKLVILDTLRLFCPAAIEKGNETAAAIQRMRKATGTLGCSFLLIHHIRKRDRKATTRVTLEDGHDFFEEAAGARAIVNSTDTRLGLEPSSDRRADLTMAGFARLTGWLGPFAIARELDDDGEPKGYKLLRGEEFLNDKYREIFEALPSTFRFKDVKQTGGLGSSSADQLIKQAMTHGVITKDGAGYRKSETL